MTRGEFSSIGAMHNVLPRFVPRPIACGTYRTIPDTHFFLCEFPKMIDDMPHAQKFATLLSKLHQKSASPTGNFGFHVTIYAGNLPQFVALEDSWETFFAKTMRQALGLEIERNGPSEELDVVCRAQFERVIPSPLTRWPHMNDISQPGYWIGHFCPSFLSKQPAVMLVIDPGVSFIDFTGKLNTMMTHDGSWTTEPGPNGIGHRYACGGAPAPQRCWPS